MSEIYQVFKVWDYKPPVSFKLMDIILNISWDINKSEGEKELLNGKFKLMVCKLSPSVIIVTMEFVLC